MRPGGQIEGDGADRTDVDDGVTQSACRTIIERAGHNLRSRTIDADRCMGGAAANTAVRIVQRRLHVKPKHGRIGEVIAGSELQSRIALGKGNEVIVIDLRGAVVLEQRTVGDVRDLEVRDLSAIGGVAADHQTRSGLSVNGRGRVSYRRRVGNRIDGDRSRRSIAQTGAGVVLRGGHVKAERADRTVKVRVGRELQTGVALCNRDEVAVINLRRPIVLEQRAVGHVRDLEDSDVNTVGGVLGDHQT